MRMIIVGCGRNGSALAQALDRMGHTVTVIDTSAAAFKALGPAFRGEVIEGVGFDREVLSQAKIDRTDALAAFTTSDESNAVIARIAREVYRVPKVIARLYDRGKAEIYRHLGIQTLSSTSWAVRRAVDLLCYSPLNPVLTVGSGDVEIVEIEVPPMMAGRKVGEINLPGEIQIAAIARGGRSMVPTLGTAVERGDVLYIAAQVASGGRLKRLFGLAGQEGI